jgi:predicted MFS family arabinose efflux permease
MFAVVVPMLIMTSADGVAQLTIWRFVQGLLLPPIFAVTVAYIGDEWPPADVTRVAGLYISGSAIGGFSGRFVPGLLTDVIGWRAAFQVVALLTLVAAIIVAAMLPRERNFAGSGGLMTSLTQMMRHLRNRQLVATYAIGFGVLFNFVATFTYVNFHLAAPPSAFRRPCSAPCFSHIWSAVRSYPGSAGRLHSSAAAALCLGSSPCGWSAHCCCWRRPLR